MSYPFRTGFSVLVGLSMSVTAASAHEPPGGSDFALYDPDPDHLWNRIHRALLMREYVDGNYYGHDDFELLYWHNTKHPLESPKYEEILELFDEFLKTNGENLIEDSLKRALLQRDLWNVFDWLARSGRRTMNQREGNGGSRRAGLQVRLATMIRRLALPRDEIQELSSNYVAKSLGSSAESLPLEVLLERSGWLRLPGSGEDLGARIHVLESNAQSLFDVYIKLSSGEIGAEEYLLSLLDVSNPFKSEPNPSEVSRTPLFGGLPPGVVETEDLLQFPVGTEVALVRRMMLVDDTGTIQPTNFIESLQHRRYDAIEDFRREENSVSFEEYRMSRTQFLQDANAGLVALEPNARRFVTFRSHGFDPFEGARARPNHVNPDRARPVALDTCAACHSGPGVYSFLSRARLLKHPNFFRDPHSDSNELIQRERALDDAVAVQTKRERDGWGLLVGLWRNGVSR